MGDIRSERNTVQGNHKDTPHTQRFDACVIRNSIPLLKQQYFDNNGMCWLKIVSGVTWVHVLACRQELSLIPIHWMSHRTFFPRRFDSRCLRHQSVWFNLLHDIERRPRQRWCLISNISATFPSIDTPTSPYSLWSNASTEQMSKYLGV